MSETVRILVLTKYGRLGASSRLRFLQYLPYLEQAGIDVVWQPLLSDEVLLERYGQGSYGLWSLFQAYGARCRALIQRRHFDVLWIEKEALQWFPLWTELSLLRGSPYILDYDDAVFHNYDRHTSATLRRIFGHRIDGLMARSALVVGGNNYLAQRARNAGAPRVEVLPTVIDLDRYPVRPTAMNVRAEADKLPRIVWIGSPSTVKYLQLLLAPLQELAKKQPFVLRVIGGGVMELPGITVESMTWSEETEVGNIQECDVGVMPLLDSPWEQGKCGYKLIQYMACGLPVVASGVGVNTEIVQQGKNGFLANTHDEWVTALDILLSDKLLRVQMGLAGHQRVAHSYCIQQTGPRLLELLRSVLRCIQKP